MLYVNQFSFQPINFNPLSANITKWSNALKQFVGKLLTNCLSVFVHFVGLVLKALKPISSFKLVFLNWLK